MKRGKGKNKAWCALLYKNTTFHDLVNDYERGILTKVLADTEGNQRRAAKILGLSPSSMCSLLLRLNVNANSFKRKGPDDSLISLEDKVLTDSHSNARARQWTKDSLALIYGQSRNK